MSKLGDVFRAVGAYLMQSEPIYMDAVNPEVGMTWVLEQHRRYKNPNTHAKKEMLGKYQIASVDDRGVGLVENGCYYKVFAKSDWDEIYTKNFAQARSAGGMTGGGSILPVYIGYTEAPDLKYVRPTVTSFLYFEGNELALDVVPLEDALRISY